MSFFPFKNLFQTEKGLKVKKDRYDCFCFCSSITKTNKISYLIIIAGTKAKGIFYEPRKLLQLVENS